MLRKKYLKGQGSITREEDALRDNRINIETGKRSLVISTLANYVIVKISPRSSNKSQMKYFEVK